MVGGTPFPAPPKRGGGKDTVEGGMRKGRVLAKLASGRASYYWAGLARHGCWHRKGPLTDVHRRGPLTDVHRKGP